MRLIDAEQIGLTDMEIIMCDGSYKKGLEMLIDKIDNAPTIDAVPVTRCKDCKHWNADWQNTEGYHFCYTRGDYFCADAERREE